MMEATSSLVHCAARKRALLIGICFDELKRDLKLAHDDVYKMQDFLVEAYDYTLSQITILVDDGIEGHSQPTRASILEAIQELVKDVKAGDHSGTSTRILNRSSHKENDTNACLITSDGLNIIDSELHATLVQPLPSDSHLVAVLDTCHSGSLLGLEHFRCNRVYVPWVSKGNRNSEEIRNVIVRGNARLGTIAQNANPARQTHMYNVHTSSTGTHPSMMGTPSASSSQSLSAMGSYSKSRSLARLRTGTKGPLMWLRTSTLSIPPQNPGKNDEQPGTWILPDEEMRCESPVEELRCNGWCRTMEWFSEQNVRADVISLASCRSSQLSWEGVDTTMTSRLINLLRDDPHQSLKDVLVRISYASYSYTLRRHGESKTYKKRRKVYAASIVKKIKQLPLEPKYRSTVSSALADTQSANPQRRLTFPQVNMPRPRQLLRTIIEALADLKQKLKLVDQNRGYDMVNFQNPELASPRPLDMNRLFLM
ncbi:caspase domain-containing protein [Mycena sanguinolenta]|nr:caspase domain-containing protein [Mycena sanguinolenta]